MKYLLLVLLASTLGCSAQTIDQKSFNPERALNQARGETIGGCVLVAVGAGLFGGAMHRSTSDPTQLHDRTNSLLWCFGTLSIGGGLTMIVHGGILRVKAHKSKPIKTELQ